MRNKSAAGNALFYVFMAIGLLAALTYSFVKGGRENLSAQNAARVAEEIYVQANLIKSSILQCTMEYVEGGGDIDGDGDIDAPPNNNVPFPLEPDDPEILNSFSGCTTQGDAVGCVTQAANKNLRNLSCVGAPLGSSYIFGGANNSGSFLPPPPQGFNEWTYHNTAEGVYLQIVGQSNNATAETTIDRLENKYVECQADKDYNNCGTNCIVIWVKRKVCPPNP